MRLECLTCRGTYDDVLPDGSQYFHVCPPLSLPELQAAVDDGRVLLIPPETVDEAHSRRLYQRTLARNENVAPSAVKGQPPKIIAVGRDTREVILQIGPPSVVVVPD